MSMAALSTGGPPRCRSSRAIAHSSANSYTRFTKAWVNLASLGLYWAGQFSHSASASGRTVIATHVCLPSWPMRIPCTRFIATSGASPSRATICSTSIGPVTTDLKNWNSFSRAGESAGGTSLRTNRSSLSVLSSVQPSQLASTNRSPSKRWRYHW